MGRSPIGRSTHGSSGRSTGAPAASTEAPAGIGRPGCLLAVALLALITYVGIPLVRAEIRLRSAREQIEEAARGADDPVELREHVVSVVEKLQLPPGAERVQVDPAGSGRLRATVTYADTVLRVLIWERVIPRSIVAETP